MPRRSIRHGAVLGALCILAVAACSDDGGGEPGLERIDGPAEVDEDRLEEQTPDGGTVRGG